jgi:uncharacterized membrane protein YidH (DUF202 family)
MADEDFHILSYTSRLIITSLGFVLSLSLNQAFKTTFAKIPLGTEHPILKDWVHFAVVLCIVFFVLFIKSKKKKGKQI